MATNSKEKQREYDAKRAGRTRNFTTIVYPESAPENWLEILQQLFVPALVSPLHDKDV
ncbi:MAG: Rep family protein, partial [Klebsiella pneumoniae]|nr:Rep family protein [Klebsiella pneumoniae]